MKISETLEQARNLIQTHGHVKKIYGAQQLGYCSVGAIQTVAALTETQSDATRALAIAIGLDIETAENENLIGVEMGIVQWNDADDRTRDEVIAAFNLAIAQSQERGN